MLTNEVAAPRFAGPFSVFHDGCPADLEFDSEVDDPGAGAVMLEELVDFLRFQAVLYLLLGERSGSSTG
jgi:hypothetical protein